MLFIIGGDIIKTHLGYDTKLIFRNFFSLFNFEILDRFIMISLFLPLLKFSLNIVMRFSGIRYLTGGTLKGFLNNKSTIFIMVLLGVLLTFYTYFEINCLIFCFNSSRNKIKVNIYQIFHNGFEQIKKLIMPRNILVFLFTALFIPLPCLSLFSFSLAEFNLKALTSWISKNLGRTKLFIIIAFVIVYILLFLFYLLFLHSFNIDEKSFTQAIKATIAYVRKKKCKTLLSIIIWLLLTLIVFILIYVILLLIAGLIINYFFYSKYKLAIYMMTANTIRAVVIFIAFVLSFPLVIVSITSSFYMLSHASKKVYFQMHKPLFKITKKSKRIFTALVAIFILCDVLYITVFSNMFDIYNFGHIKYPEVTAHRGASQYAPENTIPAIELAIEQLADVVEIDVQLTSDNVVILSHDPTFKRIAGYEKPISECTYDELLKLDVGKWFSNDYIDTRVPTLDEALKAGDKKIKFNIELKGTTKRILAEEVVKTIEENNYVDDCIITSFNYDLLKAVKEINPDIKTALISSLVIGMYNKISDVDGLSLNYNMLTPSIVNDIHNAGFFIFAWTANSDTAINRMITFGVDNIITDNPIKVKETTLSGNDDIFIRNIKELVFG